ncbi:hypothetical protein HDV05_002717 [Chytridiales sp. JEL 0842]|nr:hypothetical protein HDV05_002717 [Chytridiales sp. JEL 0842]
MKYFKLRQKLVAQKKDELLQQQQQSQDNHSADQMETRKHRDDHPSDHIRMSNSPSPMSGRDSPKIARKTNNTDIASSSPNNSSLYLNPRRIPSFSSNTSPPNSPTRATMKQFSRMNSQEISAVSLRLPSGMLDSPTDLLTEGGEPMDIDDSQPTQETEESEQQTRRMSASSLLFPTKDRTTLETRSESPEPLSRPDSAESKKKHATFFFEDEVQPALTSRNYGHQPKPSLTSSSLPPSLSLQTRASQQQNQHSPTAGLFSPPSASLDSPTPTASSSKPVVSALSKGLRTPASILQVHQPQGLVVPNSMLSKPTVGVSSQSASGVVYAPSHDTEMEGAERELKMHHHQQQQQQQQPPPQPSTTTAAALSSILTSAAFAAANAFPPLPPFHMSTSPQKKPFVTTTTTTTSSSSSSALSTSAPTRTPAQPMSIPTPSDPSVPHPHHSPKKKGGGEGHRRVGTDVSVDSEGSGGGGAGAEGGGSVSSEGAVGGDAGGIGAGAGAGAGVVGRGTMVAAAVTTAGGREGAAGGPPQVKIGKGMPSKPPGVSGGLGSPAGGPRSATTSDVGILRRGFSSVGNAMYHLNASSSSSNPSAPSSLSNANTASNPFASLNAYATSGGSSLGGALPPTRVFSQPGALSSFMSQTTPPAASSADGPNRGSMSLDRPTSSSSWIKKKSLQVHIRRRSSATADFGGSYSSVGGYGSPMYPTSGSSAYGNNNNSHMTPSPAVSFLSSLAENMCAAAQAPPRGVYFEGDQIGDWILIKEIGHGSFSRVFEAAPADSSLPSTLEMPAKVAIKVVRKMTTSEPADSESVSDTSSVTGTTGGGGGGGGGPGSLSHSTSVSSLSSMRSNSGLDMTATHSITAPTHPTRTHSGSSGAPNTVDPAMEDVQRLLDHECKIWSSLSHPHILKMMDVMEVEDALFVVSELAEGGTLLDYIQRRRLERSLSGAAGVGGVSLSASATNLGGFGGGGGWGSSSSGTATPTQGGGGGGGGGLGELEARHIFRQVASAIRYLHCVEGIVHRDIKCENILIMRSQEESKDKPTMPPSSSLESKDDPTRSSSTGSLNMSTDDLNPPSETFCCHPGYHSPLVKLADFGLSDYITTSPPPSPSTLIASDPIFCMGSIHYCAPEELRATVTKSPASDVWSLGCVLYAMLTGSLPFQDGFLPRLQAMIVNGRYDLGKLERCGVSREGKELVEGMLKVKVEQRLTIQEVCEHAWLAVADSV